MAKRFLGITVLADFVLNEGIDGVLDNLTERAGATAVAINPTVTAPNPNGMGSQQPPSDAGSSPRVFDRPLWGRKSLWVRSASSYVPNDAYYQDTPYAPRRWDDLTEEHGAIIEQFIDAALDRGLEVYFQVGASTPPRLRNEDIPLLPNGRRPERMAETGSLASPAIRGYIAAYVRDLLDKYPQITGFRPDWPEYPCYKLDEAFQDFCPHVAAWSAEHGFDFERIRTQVGAFYDHLHGSLTNRDLEGLAGPDRGKTACLTLLRRYPAILEWLQLKTALSLDLLEHWRASITEYGGSQGGADKKLSANAFMTPFSLFTGLDFAGAAAICDAVSPKLYTMHWSVMVEFWGRDLLAHNPGLDEKLVVKALAHLFDLGDEITAEQLSDYGYPEPHEPHPIPDDCQARKIRQVCAEVAGNAVKDRAAVTPLAHGYGPLKDFCRRFKVVADSAADGVWVNRYGYLSDAKLDAVGKLWGNVGRADDAAAEQGDEREEAQPEPNALPTDLDGLGLDALAATWPIEHLGALLDATMVFVPAGPFIMGETKRESETDAFYIDRYPVTNAQYARFVRETGRETPKHWEDGAIPEGKLLHPVVNVTWHDADAYARWAGKRLPMEAEWEKAARGTDGRTFPWGNEFAPDRCNSKESGPGGTTAVNGHSPAGDSPYGCADMVGNVWEWCADWYRMTKDVRSVRGGGYWNGEYGVRCDSRGSENPNVAYLGCGFRCASSNPPSGS